MTFCKAYIKLFCQAAQRSHKKKPDEWISNMPDIMIGPASENLIEQMKKYEKYHREFDKDLLEIYLLDLLSGEVITGFDFGGKKNKD